jgi:hypothetical protein
VVHWDIGTDMERVSAQKWRLRTIPSDSHNPVAVLAEGVVDWVRVVCEFVKNSVSWAKRKLKDGRGHLDPP